VRYGNDSFSNFCTTGRNKAQALQIAVATLKIADKYSAMGLLWPGELEMEFCLAPNKLSIENSDLVFGQIVPAVFAEDTCKPLAAYKKRVVNYTIALARKDKALTKHCRRAMHEYEEFMTLVVEELARTQPHDW
jgi:hypothetical protein